MFGACTASFAEYSVARPDGLAGMPANLSFEQAAAVPVSAVTALQALRDRGPRGVIALDGVPDAIRDLTAGHVRGIWDFSCQDRRG